MVEKIGKKVKEIKSLEREGFGCDIKSYNTKHKCMWRWAWVRITALRRESRITPKREDHVECQTIKRLRFSHSINYLESLISNF